MKNALRIIFGILAAIASFAAMCAMAIYTKGGVDYYIEGFKKDPIMSTLCLVALLSVNFFIIAPFIKVEHY